VKPGRDPDDVAQAETDHFGNCPVCGALPLIDMRATSRKCWCMFTTQRLRSVKVRSRRRVPPSPEKEVWG
jgi:hypothetical protein